MREVNLSGLDLNLLPPLAALLVRRNVTQAASDVGLSQPAMSRALARLRLELDDPLLVRVGGRMQLTPRAEALVPQVDQAMEGLKALFRPVSFDPGTVERTVRLAATDSQTVLLLPAVMARLAIEAPGLTLKVESYGSDLISRMESGRIDMAFALATTPLPPGAVSDPVATDRMTLVMRRGHPAANRDWSLADYAAFDHAGIAILGDGTSEVDTWLAAEGLSRRIALVTPHFTAALAAVAATDMVTTLSRAYARRFAPLFDLIIREPPFAAVDLPMTLVSPQVRSGDPLLQWLRRLIREVAIPIYEAEAGEDV